MGLAERTQSQYHRKAGYWLEFCADFGKDPLAPNVKSIIEFMGYMVHMFHKSGEEISRCLLAISHHCRIHGVSWKWSSYEQIKYAVKACRNKWPDAKRFRKPMCHEFVAYAWQKYMNKEVLNFRYWAILNGISLGYWLGLRPGEYAKYKGSRLLKFKALTFRPMPRGYTLGSDIFPYPQVIKEMNIRLDFSKTNQHGHEKELLSIECKCNQRRFGMKIKCPVHAMYWYLMGRKMRFGKIKPDDPLLVTEKNKPISWDQVSKFCWNWILDMNDDYDLTMDPGYYTPHALRVGGTTDLGREGTSAWKISQFGRWRSDCWQDVYIKLDFQDLADLRKCTISSIRNQFNASDNRRPRPTFGGRSRLR